MGNGAYDTAGRSIFEPTLIFEATGNFRRAADTFNTSAGSVDNYSAFESLETISLLPNTRNSFSTEAQKIFNLVIGLLGNIDSATSGYQNIDEEEVGSLLDGGNPTGGNSAGGNSTGDSSGGGSGTTPSVPTDPGDGSGSDVSGDGTDYSHGLTPAQLTKFSSLLTQIAADLGISVEELLNNEKYKAHLQKIIDEDVVIADVNVLLSDVPDEHLKAQLTSLTSELGISMDELLTNPDYSSQALTLLGSVGISDTSRLTGGEAQILIKNLITEQTPGQIGITADTMSTMFSELGKCAKDEGIQVSDLLSNPDYAAKLENKLLEIGDANKVVSDIVMTENSQEALYDNYNSSTGNSYIKEYVANVASSNGLTVDKLLTDVNNSKLVQESMVNLQNQTTYVKTITVLKGEGIQTTVNYMYSGKDPGLLGLTKSESNNFETVINNVAKLNNVTPEEMLNDRKYANSLNQNLSKLDTSGKLSNTFGSGSDSEVQQVLNNIYSGK